MLIKEDTIKDDETRKQPGLGLPTSWIVCHFVNTPEGNISLIAKLESCKLDGWERIDERTHNPRSCYKWIAIKNNPLRFPFEHQRETYS